MKGVLCREGISIVLILVLYRRFHCIITSYFYYYYIGDTVSCEEKRLMESIEFINNKLRTIPLTNRTTTVSILYHIRAYCSRDSYKVMDTIT